MKYIICKASRTPWTVSYNWPAFDSIGIEKRKDIYEDLNEAISVADELVKHNQVWFEVYDLESEKEVYTTNK